LYLKKSSKNTNTSGSKGLIYITKTSKNSLYTL
jgi:hypothetical protein